jgi:hypothetical protein
MFLATHSPFNDWEDQARRRHRVMEDAIDRRLILIAAFAGDYAARVAVAVKAREVAARNLQADAVAR